MYTLKIATTKSELQEIFKLRFKAYVEDYGTHLRHIDMENQQIKDALDETAINVGAWYNDQLVGCVRLNMNFNGGFVNGKESSGMARYSGLDPEKCSMSTKFAVNPEFQHSRLNVLLQQYLYKVGLANNQEYCFLECKDHLVSYYLKFGFRLYTDESFTNDFGHFTPMVLDLLDIDYLRGRRSPFVSVYESVMAEKEKVYAQAA